MTGRAAVLALLLLAQPAAGFDFPKPPPPKFLRPSGNPATLQDCRRAGMPEARITVNTHTCISNKPCAMRRWCAR